MLAMLVLADVGALLLGLLLLYLGAEWLIKGAAGLARELGVRPLIVGMTVIAYGTSAPELIVSTVASLEGRGAIAIGNVIGSNIANIGLILGVTALIQPILVEGSLIRRELPIMVIATLALPLVLLNGMVGRVEAAILLLGAVSFTIMAVRAGVPNADEITQAVEADAEMAGAPGGGGRLRLALIGTVGLLLLLGGGKLFVDGAAGLALKLGMSERVVGLTIVAFGTSVPELAASIVAAMRGHAAIAVGNVIGSNIFNVLFVVGGAGLIRPFGADLREFGVSLVAVAAFTAFAFFAMRKARHVTRVEGALLAGGYVAFLVAVALL
jgi:cation:H+ antiporter